jgi:hypothetical protein
MATFEITGVRTEKTIADPHEHIADVKIGTGLLQLPRATVIRDLRTPGGDRYYTYGGGKRADVIVAGCPRCTFRDYITTTPDTTTANNLLSLPRF